MDEEIYFMLHTLVFMYVIQLIKKLCSKHIFEKKKKLRIIHIQNVEKTKIQKFCMSVFTFSGLYF